MVGAEPLGAAVERRLWPLLDGLVGTLDVAGLAVAVVRGDETVARGFGVRDVGTGAPVTPETMFHLASVSKPFVAAAVVSLAAPGPGGPAVLDLDAPVVDLVPELQLADGRQREVTARGLLSHTSGLPDVTEYAWHVPRLDDDALTDFARSLSWMRLRSDPGTAFSYSNAGYELLGLLVARAVGTTVEEALRRLVLDPLGMTRSTFLRADVPAELAAAPHVGLPLAVPEGSYPYTRTHAPSSSLHSNLEELGGALTVLLGTMADAGPGHHPPLDPAALDLATRPVVVVGEPPWDESMGLGWALGTYRGRRTVGHSGLDPGFGSRVVLLPEERTGVVVLANSDTVPAGVVTMAALDVVLAGGTLSGDAETGIDRIRALRRPVAGPVAEVLVRSGTDAAVAEYHRLLADDPPAVDPDDEGFADAVWGAIELHRTELVRPMLDLWTTVRPDSSAAWTMTGWADSVEGDTGRAHAALRRALDLDPGNEEAAQLLAGLPRG
jgi:CubicO group peptidase (beta-lactamase class C family)